ncbi:putative ankyrin repeat protein RF_0381 [Saccostrea cucullata]|uniref:putative ankyrin repeat protein RF_0381 n=1 Tax=Saccostrea cuccullata TaxID=36930 RepID=UPI002ED5C1AD
MTPFFVKTRAYNKAKELLEAKRYIIIKGNPGTGKTTIAKMLMKELMEEGKSALQLQKFTDLYESVSPGDDKTYALQEAEILQLADKYDLKNTIEKQDLLRKVHEMPIWIGFPQCCKLAKSNAVIKQKISDFLLDPKMFLREYFKILIKTQTSKSAVLAYLLLSGGRVEFELIDNAHKDLELKRTSLEFTLTTCKKSNDTHVLIEQNSFDAVAIRIAKISAERLLEIRDNNGWTVLHSACSGGSVEIVSFLIEKGMDINTLSNDDGHQDPVQGGGETILHQCCRSGKMEMCEYLVKHFSNLLEMRDNDGWTALHSACFGGSKEIVNFLLNKGLDINALSNDGKSILHIACFSGKFEVCKYLVENNPHLLHVRDKSSETVLHDAAWGGNVQIVELLIEKKMDVNSRQEVVKQFYISAVVLVK